MVSRLDDAGLAGGGRCIAAVTDKARNPRSHHADDSGDMATLKHAGSLHEIAVGARCVVPCGRFTDADKAQRRRLHRQEYVDQMDQVGLANRLGLRSLDRMVRQALVVLRAIKAAGHLEAAIAA